MMRPQERHINPGTFSEDTEALPDYVLNRAEKRGSQSHRKASGGSELQSGDFGKKLGIESVLENLHN